jgi:hypothetical protein
MQVALRSRVHTDKLKFTQMFRKLFTFGGARKVMAVKFMALDTVQKASSRPTLSLD